MAENVFRQSYVSVAYNGRILRGLADGRSIVVRPRGGGVELTEGTDGSDVNIAADQGVTVEVRLRETSPDHEALLSAHLSQQRGGPGATLVLYTGTARTLTAADCFVSLPGDLETGGPLMGWQTYTFAAARYDFA